jgi:hypothetical protein
MVEFADNLPTDEDQMPFDGNPHPLPGHLLMNPNLFVGPQFPEIGWDVLQPPEMPQENDIQHDDQEQDMVFEVDEQESMILNPSQNSGSSVNGFEGNGLPLQVGFVSTYVYGHVIPPHMSWKKLWEFVLPQMLAKSVQPSLLSSPFLAVSLTNSWESAPVPQVQLSEKSMGHGSVLDLSDFRRPVACALTYEQSEYSIETGLCSEHFVSPVSVPKKRGRPRKVQPPLVEPANRHFTRSSLKLDGYRSRPVIEKTKKKVQPRAKLLLSQATSENLVQSAMHPDNVAEEMVKITPANEDDGAGGATVQTPETPIPVLQRVGRQLGISPDKLTKEVLEAAPSDQTKDLHHDD